MKTFKHIKTKQQFIARANLKHNNFYDYSLVEYEERPPGLTHNGKQTRKLAEYYSEAYITIICPKHGEFSQRSRKHIEGSGCSACALETRTDALVGRNGEVDFASANNFKEAENCIVIKTKPSDGIEREILISTEDKEVLQFATWRATGHQQSRLGRSLYCVGQQTNRMTKENYEWLGSKPKLHRLIMSRKLRRVLHKNEHIDHINGNGLDNRRENLRFASNAQNHTNQKKQRGEYSSKYKGVCYVKRVKKWLAYIGSSKKNSIVQRKYLGSYDCEEKAGRAYDKAAIEFYGEFAVLNFPENSY
tara:strand:+ start:842 stop:1753 length:912 start_codon:yes stop_codon:yes gene_type:complete